MKKLLIFRPGAGIPAGAWPCPASAGAAWRNWRKPIFAYLRAGSTNKFYELNKILCGIDLRWLAPLLRVRRWSHNYFGQLEEVCDVKVAWI